MAAISRLRQTFLQDVIQKIEYTSKIAICISIFWAFDRRSSWSIDGNTSILKNDLLCDLVTPSMTSWLRFYTNVVIVSWYLCTGSLMMISSLVFLVIMKNVVISLINEYRVPTFRPSVTSSSWKILLWHNLRRSFHTWGQIAAVFNILKFSKWPTFWARDKLFHWKWYRKLNIPER